MWNKLASFWKKYIVDDYQTLFGPEMLAPQEALSALEWNCSLVGEFYELGFISKEQAKPFVLQHCREYSDVAGKYLKAGLITIEEARPFIAEGCEL